jgi:hypothetical protein
LSLSIPVLEYSSTVLESSNGIQVYVQLYVSIVYSDTRVLEYLVLKYSSTILEYLSTYEYSSTVLEYSSIKISHRRAY